jgi:hypothetical protein
MLRRWRATARRPPVEKEASPVSPRRPQKRRHYTESPTARHANCAVAARGSGETPADDERCRGRELTRSPAEV